MRDLGAIDGADKTNLAIFYDWTAAMTKSQNRILPYALAMAFVVALSNYLVQFPVQATLGGVNLADILTLGAFTYPVAFLVTDLTNRKFGIHKARLVVAAGFVFAVILSFWLASPRIAIASGSAFLMAQFTDISIFDRLRHNVWWAAPMVSSLLGSVVDTIIFFSIAFGPAFGVLDFGGDSTSLGFPVPFLGVGEATPLWLSLAAGDLLVKLLVGLTMLIPYGILIRRQIVPDSV